MTRFLFSVWRLRVSWCVAPSLTRGRVCNLLVQLLLGLARAVTVGSKSRRTHGHILLSHLRLPNLEGQVPVFISSGTRWPSYTPGHWVPFCRLLRLTGMRWRYSNPPPHGDKTILEQRTVFIVGSISQPGLENREYGRRDPSRWPRGTLYPHKLAPTSQTSGGRSWTQATEFSCFFF
jgi:hypothetical protein